MKPNLANKCSPERLGGISLRVSLFDQFPRTIWLYLGTLSPDAFDLGFVCKKQDELCFNSFQFHGELQPSP
jgi:hypothetical protein